MKLRSLLLTLLATICALPLAAQLESGKVYRFINKADASIAMSAATTTTIYGAAVADGNYAQLWLAEQHPNNSDAWSLRSLGNGLYMKPMGTSTKWTFTTAPNSSTVLYCLSTGSGYYTMNNAPTAGAMCMHYATSQGGAVVGWNTGADATHWKIEEVAISPEDLQANWEDLDAFNSALTDEFQATCKAALANLFNDAACTDLKKDFASVAEIEADADYQALPKELQNMVKKVYTGDWSEGNFDSSKPGWDSEHSKRFRVQNIEPYSVAGEITAWLGINAHANMDNPTGIIGNSRQHVYIFVEGEVKQGAELYVGSLVGHGMLDAYDSGTPLKPGMNVLAFHGDKNSLYINYVVHTYTNGSFPNKLSDFPGLKVHIEGGNITGYYNAVGDHLWGEPDDDEDWQYYEDRSVVESATLLGKYQILHFCMHDTKYVANEETGATAWESGMSFYLPDNINVPAGTPANQKVNTMLEAWDRVHMSEFATMGLLTKAQLDSVNALYPRYDQNWQKAGNIYDYSDLMYQLQNGRDYGEYINHHGVALGTFSGYMSGGWRNCNYHHNTMHDIIGNIAVSAGQAWGPGHEIGHQHQSAMTVNGLTEVTNNLFSNVAVWYMGLGTSRVNGSEGCLDRVNAMYQEGTHFLFHHQIDGAAQNLWSQTQMYYRLWLYFHRIGKNTAFFPRLYEMCRQYRLSNNALGSYEGISHTSGTMSTLRFYEHACEAAKMDLTEFFRAYGFFVPLDHELRDDYANSYYTQTQDEINASIARVKAKGYPETVVPLFINDCVAIPTYGHDGKTVRSYWDNETAQGKNALLGMYTSCMDESVAAEGYLYNIVNGEIRIVRSSGAKGAIGFIAYNNGNLVAFTNNYTVSLPAGVTTADIYAVQADGTKVKLLSAAEGGTEEQQYDALAKALSSALTALGNTDASHQYVGFFYESALEDLQALYDGGFDAWKNKSQATHTYGQWAILITNEINRLVVDTKAMLSFKATNIYTLANSVYPSNYLAIHEYALKAASSSQVPSNSDNRRWEFVSAGEEGVFYLKNVGTGLYISGLENGETANAAATSTSAAVKFVATYNGDGTISLSKQGDYTASLNCNSDKSISGANIANNASKWTAKLVVDNARLLEQAQLNTLIDNAERILNEVGTADNLNNGVIALSDNLAQLLSDIEAAKASAEANYNAVELVGYIEVLQNAITAIDGTYMLTPISSKDTGVITWYYLRSVNKGVYCSGESVGSGHYANAISYTTDIDREDRKYWWAFVATGNENEYELYNAATETYVYTNSGFTATMKLDGAKDAGAYLVTIDTEKAAITLSQGTKYMSDTHNTNARMLTDNNRYWRLEYIGTEAGSLTGIEEVIGDDSSVKGIYDITGRKIETITAPGIYIVDGKKVLVK